MNYYTDRDFGDENDFNEWVDSQYEDFDEEDDFYLDPEYWNNKDEEDEGETGVLALV